MSVERNVCVWGGGAVGGTVAACLAKAGVQVVLVDTDRAHLDAINDHGLRLATWEGETTVPLEAMPPQEAKGPFSTVLLAVKAHHTEIAARAIAPLLADDGVVVSLQNGLCETELADILGPERVLGAFINFGADVTGPGRILYANRGTFVIGELDGKTRPRTDRILDLVKKFEPDAILSDNVWGYLWGKQAYSATLKASGLSEGTLVDFLADARWRHLNEGLVREVLKVAASDGIRPLGFNGFDPEPFARGDRDGMKACLDEMAAFYRASTKTHSSTWRDIAVFRQKTDASAQLAPVLAAAQRNTIAVPLLSEMIALIGGIEAGRLEQGEALLERLDRAGRTQ